ncbi:ion channel [Algoriphagus aquaeductus]|uniref:Ion channel n=1 Tax=Algoriphagus aquaeductus TaxID=475299 RepID=A0A326RT03_9BACT|nr:potassium channel family protein [Algoriphagus aquaeductus]PZV83827.1 ion channel [Algoriphagus aquaeductus]
MQAKAQLQNLIRHINEYWLTDASFVVLLVTLIFTVFFLPVLIEFGQMDVFFVNLVFLFLFFTGIWSSANTFLMVLTSLLFVAQLVLRLLRFSSLPVEFYLAERVVGLANMMVFIFLNIRLLFRNDEINLYRVIGAINVYLLLAVLGAFAFEIVNLLLGDSISGLHEFSGLDQDFSVYIYFSLVSLTTVGFGDYIPVNVVSKMISVFLSAVGILYPAIVISKLVGSSVQRKQS